MDTPTITQYYREHDPMKRKKLLEQSIEAGELPKENAVRMELWNLRYASPSQVEKNNRADGYLAMWMSMEFNKEAGKGFFGSRGAKKEIVEHLKKLKFIEIQEKGGLYEELLYRECCHMVKMYMELCETDKSYGSTFCGLINITQDKLVNKIRRDIEMTAVELPSSIQMEKELGIITRAAKEMYRLKYPDEEEI